jgi:hypothetical protein
MELTFQGGREFCSLKTGNKNIFSGNGGDKSGQFLTLGFGKFYDVTNIKKFEGGDCGNSD